MKTSKVLLRTAMAVAVMFGCQQTASAQFGNILGKAKDKVVNTAKNTAENAVDKAKNKAEEKARKKMWEVVKKKVLEGKQMPELPWPMAEGVCKSYSWPPKDDDPKMNVTYYLYNLPNTSEADVRDLKAKLDARYNANKKIMMAAETGLFSQLGEYTSRLLHEIEEEQGRWAGFYGEIQQFMSTHMQGKIKDLNGNMSWELTWDFGDTMVDGDRQILTVSKNKSGVMQFYGLASKQGIYAGPEDLKLINADVDRMKKIIILTDGLTTEFDDPNPAPANKNLAAQLNFRAKVFVNNVQKALASNTPENIERHPMPKAGSLNKSLKAKALALAKAEESSVIDVVITSNSWNVKPLERRSVSGYVIKKDEYGKRAFARTWCQDYMGGGKYGSLRNYGVGMGSFYLK